MPNTYIDYTAPVDNYTFTFPYLNVSHVKVFVDGVEKTQGTHYTVGTSPTRVIFTNGNAPTNGQIVRIRRVTFKDSALVDFVNGATLIESDLDTAVRQTLYINQETTELNDTALQIGAGTTDFYAQNKKITDVANPTNANDAANKTYVDSTSVSVTGDTMTGALAMSNNKITGLGTPTDSADAATKSYVDTNDALKLNKAGDTMSGNLAMAGNRVTGLANPASAQDAATQASVNAAISSAVQFGSTTPPDVYSFTGDGTDTTFSLGAETATTVLSSSAYIVSIDGVVQKPDDDFSLSLVSGDVILTFVAAPPNGSSIVVQAIGYKVPIGDEQIPNDAITAAKLATDSVTTSKIQNGAVTSAKLASSVDFTGKTVSGLTKSNVGLDNVQNVNQADANNITSGTLSVGRLPPVDPNFVFPGTYGTVSAGTFQMPRVSVDAYGRVVGVSNQNWVGRRLVNMVVLKPDCTSGKVPGLFTASPWLNLIPVAWTDIFAGTGYSNTYTPLAANSIIRFKYVYQLALYNAWAICHHRFQINGVDQSYFNSASSGYPENLVNFEHYWTAPNTNPITYRLLAYSYGTGNYMRAHYTYHWTGAAGQTYLQPTIIVEEYA